MFGLSFMAFNLLEGTFWILCGLVALFAGRNIHTFSPLFWQLFSATFILFGVSDYVEAHVRVSLFEVGGEWLLMWKILCVISLSVCFVWYIYKRP